MESALPVKKFIEGGGESDRGSSSPMRLRVYSSTDPYVTATTGSSNVMSKKVKARKLGHFDYQSHFDDNAGLKKKQKTETSSLRVYIRQRKTAKHINESKPKITNKCSSSSERKIDDEDSEFKKVCRKGKNEISNYESQSLAVEDRGSKMSKLGLILNKCSSNERKNDDEDSESKEVCRKGENKIVNYKLQNLAVDSSFSRDLEFHGSRELRGSKMSKLGLILNSSERKNEDEDSESKKVCRKRKNKIGNFELQNLAVDSGFLRGLECSGSRETRGSKMSKFCQDRQLKKGSASGSVKRWVELSFKDVDPQTFIGLSCKVYWPLDNDWYSGTVAGFDPETKEHHVDYEDGDSESVNLSNQKIKFHLSREEMQSLKLRQRAANSDIGGLDYEEMLVLAAGFDDCT